MKKRQSDLHTGSPESYTALIGDLVGSRNLPDRAAYQRQLSDLLNIFNRRFVHDIKSGLIITLGDEFQGLFKRPASIPAIIRELQFKGLKVRYGIGHGPISTPISEYALGSDGPAWHRARSAIRRAHKLGHLGGEYEGFGDLADVLLNGLSRCLEFHRHSITTRQAEVLSLLLAGTQQSEIMDQLQVAQPTISKLARAAGWEAYKDGESAICQLLSRFESGKERPGL